ncbi:Amidase [Dactylella cylindrospora]|nr:Amidase [Dactylella cylindrospora]
MASRNGDQNVIFGRYLIPVPSRLYFNTTNPSLPLSGKRIAIKDIIDLSGLPTSASSKAYAAYHGPASSTAAAVRKLIDLGAVVIGKTKTTQFATGETARDWIDFQCPFNPRADGYLDPAGSSTGSGAAVAGYEWVDFGLGTDSKFLCTFWG